MKFLLSFEQLLLKIWIFLVIVALIVMISNFGPRFSTGGLNIFYTMIGWLNLVPLLNLLLINKILNNYEKTNIYEKFISIVAPILALICLLSHMRVELFSIFGGANILLIILVFKSISNKT